MLTPLTYVGVNSGSVFRRAFGQPKIKTVNDAVFNEIIENAEYGHFSAQRKGENLPQNME